MGQAAMSSPKSESIEALYSQEEELNPFGHEIISRAIEPGDLSLPVNLNWPSKREGALQSVAFLDKRPRAGTTDDARLERMTGAVKVILECIGEDAAREGLLKTPERYARAMLFFTRGYTDRIEDIVNGALFEENHDEMIIVKDIEIFSMCEHHLVPFRGRVSGWRMAGLLMCVCVRFTLATFRTRRSWA